MQCSFFLSYCRWYTSLSQQARNPLLSAEKENMGIFIYQDVNTQFNFGLFCQRSKAAKEIILILSITNYIGSLNPTVYDLGDCS